MSILLIVFIFSSISAISSVIILSAFCLNKDLQITDDPKDYTEFGNLAYKRSNGTSLFEETQRPEMALNAELESLPMIGG